jgi:hypothetical protein
MAGFIPAITPYLFRGHKGVDARHKAGYDG